MNENQQWLVEFGAGTGYTCESYSEALVLAGEVVLERAVKSLETNQEAKAVINLLAVGDLSEALRIWNEMWNDPVELRTVVRGKALAVEAAKSLSMRAKDALKQPDPVPKMSLGTAIRHARHRAEVGSDPKYKQDHAQLAKWLEDLADLHREIREWRAFCDEGVSYNESLIDVFSDLKGNYDG